MKIIQRAYSGLPVTVLTLFVLILAPGFIPAQTSLNVDWAGGGVVYDRESARSIRAQQRSRERTQRQQSYGSIRYGSNVPAMLSYDDTESDFPLRQQTVTELPEGARELKVSDDLTYYIADGQYYRKTIEGGRVKYIAVEAP
jgi:hypothetical protein